MAATMDVDDGSFDASTPDSEEEEAQIQQNAPARQQRTRPGDRVIRRRARKACVECHKRKVRCDVLSRGSVCTNCRLDGLQCVLRATEGRRKVPGKDSVPQIETSSFQTSVLGPDRDLGADNYGATTYSSNKPVEMQPWPFPSQQKLNGVPNTDIMYSYYDFLEAASFSHIPSEDFKFLEYKGCFHLPNRQILDKFVEGYFKYVHPALPLLDEGQFWDMYDDSGQRPRQAKKISLFLFRCMMFASASFLPADGLAALGYRTALHARNVLYQRAKMLFNFDTVSDHISVAQGTLLLSYYCSEREPMMNTTWLRTAIQYATAEHANLYHKDSSLTPAARAEKKRLWWCCIIRDRILPLGVRRSIHINREMFDFSQPPLNNDDLESEFNRSRVYDSQTKRKLASILGTLFDFAITLTDVLPILYPAGGLKAFDQINPQALSEYPNKVKQCRELLDGWAMRTHEVSAAEDTWSTQHKSIYLFYELTQVYYQSARAALCQQESFMLQVKKPSIVHNRMQELGAEIHTVIASISESVGRLVRLDLAQYLPVAVVAYLALPIILNSIDVQGANATSFKNESKRRQLRIYNEAMDFCHARYSGTTGATNNINRIIASITEAQKKVQAAPQQASTALMRASPNEIDDWFGVFVNQPLRFLRISLSIDMSLANGKFPEYEDLPRRILLEDIKSQPSIPQAISPIVDITDLTPKDADGNEIANVNLDFFDFGAGSLTPVGHQDLSGVNWNTGNNVEMVLEQLLGQNGGTLFST